MDREYNRRYRSQTRKYNMENIDAEYRMIKTTYKMQNSEHAESVRVLCALALIGEQWPGNGAKQWTPSEKKPTAYMPHACMQLLVLLENTSHFPKYCW